MLGDDRLHFRIRLQDGPDPVHIVIAALQGDRGRHGRADPEIAFLQLRQEFEAEAAHREAGAQNQHADRAEREDAVADREP